MTTRTSQNRVTIARIPPGRHPKPGSFLWMLGCAAFLVMGCHSPFSVSTMSRIFLETPVHTLSQIHVASPVETTAKIEIDRPLETHSNIHMDAPLETTARIQMDKPLDTTAKVRLDFVPATATGRVVATSVGFPSVAPADAKVAIIDIDGLLVNAPCVGPYSQGDNPVSLLREKLEAVAKDQTVRAVVLRINSPGGSVTATDVMWNDLRRFREKSHLPVVACLMDVAAGGGYYLATTADVIVAHPTSVTGGIGVILNLYNLRELMAQFNVLGQEIKAGELIDMGTPVRPLPQKARDLLQDMANEYHVRFQSVVREARGGALTDADTFDGRVFTGQEALRRGLVDRLGYLDEAIGEAAALSGHPGATPVLYHRDSDPTRSIYDVTPNVPLQSSLWPVDVPGMNRASLPTFLYLWQPETGLDRQTGK
ncbi:MAG TPA: signal peptide peptidase SppA [Pirellulaceae bacterium]